MTKKSEDKDFFSAGLIVVGDEILTGRTQDTNTAWIAARLTERGIVLAEVRVVPDKEESIIRAVNEFREQFDYVFTTGGIGPTHDDITAESVARAFGVSLERNDEAFKALEQHYGARELTPPRAKMALVPEGARLIPNPVSAAPGFVIGNVHVMAGVPRIMQAMFDHVLDMLRGGKPILSGTVSCALPESVLAEALGGLQDAYPGIQIGSYPYYRGGSPGVSIVLRGTAIDVLEKATEDLIALIRSHGDEPSAMSSILAVDNSSGD